MTFYVSDTFTNGSGQEFNNKEDFLKELSMMIDDCEKNGGTHFGVTVDTDANRFAPNEDSSEEDKKYSFLDFLEEKYGKHNNEEEK